MTAFGIPGWKIAFSSLDVFLLENVKSCANVLRNNHIFNNDVAVLSIIENRVLTEKRVRMCAITII